ncbi:MAG: hypothetical protein CM1200mP9_03290 [Gammaproteobacteria bacterium]|nr:MAG: hypothetical protein CM1200mP9_03290 [Gammaproteobacteria bacterium]
MKSCASGLLSIDGRTQVATPVNWTQGEDVIIVPAVSDEEAKHAIPMAGSHPNPISVSSPARVVGSRLVACKKGSSTHSRFSGAFGFRSRGSVRCDDPVALVTDMARDDVLIVGAGIGGLTGLSAPIDSGLM